MPSFGVLLLQTSLQLPMNCPYSYAFFVENERTEIGIKIAVYLRQKRIEGIVKQWEIN